MKNRVKIPPYIVIPKFLSIKECKDAIRIGLTKPSIVEKFGAEEGRYSYVSAIKKEDSVNLYDKVQSKLHLLNKINYGFTLNKGIEDGAFLKYEIGNFTSWHFDGGIGGEYPNRKLSAVIMLDKQGTTYEGGNFNMPHYLQLSAKERKSLGSPGTLILFPSFVFHEVSKVTKGVRHTLAYFLEGPLFK